MKSIGYGIILALLVSLTSPALASAATDSEMPGGRASAGASVPVQTVVWRRGVRGFGPYGGAAYRAYYRPYYGGYGPPRAAYYRPYYGAYNGGW
jgi:hypothetical protein